MKKILLLLCAVATFSSLSATKVYFNKAYLEPGTYGTSDFDIIKSGSIIVHDDGTTLELDNLVVDCELTGNKGSLFTFSNNGTIDVILKGKNSLVTKGHTCFEYSHLDITFTGGELYLKSSWYDIFVQYYTNTVFVDTKFTSAGPTSIANNSAIIEDNVIVKNSTFEAAGIVETLNSFTLEGCHFVRPEGEVTFNKSRGTLECDGTPITNFLIKPDSEPVEGDVNQDGQVNVGDVTAAYNVILGSDTEFAESADVNNDGSVTVGDITAIYNIILGTN